MARKHSIIIEAALVAAFLGTGLIAAHAAHAQDAAPASATDARAVAIDSNVMVERTVTDANGAETTESYAPADVKVIPGDRLVFVNAYRNTGGEAVSGFVVNNPLPGAVVFDAVEQDWAQVSVDGGKTFGELGSLTVTDAPAEPSTDGEAATPAPRAATPADVTHVRWTFADPIAPGEAGEVAFRGRVR